MQICSQSGWWHCSNGGKYKNLEYSFVMNTISLELLLRHLRFGCHIVKCIAVIRQRLWGYNWRIQLMHAFYKNKQAISSMLFQLHSRTTVAEHFHICLGFSENENVPFWSCDRFWLCAVDTYTARNSAICTSEWT